MKLKVFLLALLCALPARAAEEQDAPNLPEVVYVAWDASSWRFDVGVASSSGVTELHKDVATDFRFDLGVEPGTGRYAIAFDGDEFEGQKFTYAGEQRTVHVLFGEIGKGIASVAAGDAKCVPAKCYEVTPIVRGSRVFTHVQRVNGTSMNAYTWGKGDAPKAIFVRSGASYPLVSDDGKTVLYVAKDGVISETVGGKAAKPLFRTRMLLENESPIATKDTIYYRRREPTKQETMLVEAWDRKTRKTRLLYTLANGINWPTSPGIWWSESHKLLVFADNVDGGSIKVVPGAGGEAKEIMKGVRQLFGLSPDGRYLLATQLTDPSNAAISAKNPERLVLYDLQTRRPFFLANPGKSHIKHAAFR